MATLVPAGVPWSVGGPFKNTQIIQGRDADPNKPLYLMYVSLSYEPEVPGTLIIRVDGQVVAQMQLHGGVSIQFVPRLRIDPGKSVEAEFKASGTQAVRGWIVLAGYEGYE